MPNINPATEEPIPTPPFHAPAEVERILARSAAAFDEWKGTGLDRRAELLRRVGALLRRDAARLSSLMASEMGKPVAAGAQEIEKCALTCDYFAEHAAGLLASPTLGSDASLSYVRYEPLGPVLAIMPWNFPFWQVFRFAAPALMAGNVGVLKHAPGTPGCARAIEGLFLEAGFPPGVFAAILISNEAAKSAIEHPAIRAVTLTGSTRAGRAVASEAGAVLKKVVLELGGSDAFIVLDDVDIASVARKAAAARCINSGQSCIAAKRFIVLDSVAEEFERAMTEAMRAIVVGDPGDPRTEVGPLARLDLLKALHAQVQRSIEQGARLLCGGAPLHRRGYFYPPTVLANVRPGMAAFDEETFGPVAAITRCVSPSEAVRLANQSSYGLGCSIWTANAPRAQELAAQVEAGCIFINGAVKSDPRLPFGGIKESGYGRELAEPGIKEFVNIKTVWVA